MSENKNNNISDSYDELLNSFYSSRSEKSGDEVKNKGEVYYSAYSKTSSNRNSKNASSKSLPQRGASSKAPSQRTTSEKNTKNTSDARRTTSGRSASPNSRTSSSRVNPRKKKNKKITSIQSAALAVLIVVIVFISAFLIRIPIMGCINDILAIDVSNTDFRVVLDKDMNVYEVIDELSKKDLINNPLFCKIFAKITGLDERTDASGNKKVLMYPAGTYFLNSSMGVEGMLLEIRSNGVVSNTVKVTFPEGFTIEQIVEKLDDSGVCSAESLYKVMVSDEIFNQYDFLAGITEKSLRYRVLEGYMYPDTYEFYIGESPTSVIERFLNNFRDKWSSTYASKAKELGYTMDEIITVASIIEKEAFDAAQMPVIASVIYNRLDSSSFPFINCDSTAQYIEKYKDKLLGEGSYNDFLKVYDTYQKTGLPVGPICCPGADAIYAALHPESTDYYYFLHDKDGKIYLASTADEHQNNLQYIE